MKSPFLVTNQEGFTPHIGRLVSMMNYARRTTLDIARGLTVEELDFLPSSDGNSIGMLLEHFAAVEVIYQSITFGYKLSTEERVRWEAGLELGKLGREKIRGHEVSCYLQSLQEVRDKTLSEFRKRDDSWLHQELPEFWQGQTSNNYFCWFHVFADEINHRGQMRLIAKHLPRFKNRGILHAKFDTFSSGRGLIATHVYPEGVAAKAGLQSGDVILELNNEDIREKPFDDIDIRGQAGETVRLKVKREGVVEPLLFEMVRGAVRND
jgi:uncharacterized damage-inducible protein DinB